MARNALAHQDGELSVPVRHDRRQLRPAVVPGAGETRPDINPKLLLYAVARLCLPVPNEGVADGQRMVALLVDGLRYGAASAAS